MFFFSEVLGQQAGGQHCNHTKHKWHYWKFRKMTIFFLPGHVLKVLGQVFAYNHASYREDTSVGSRAKDEKSKLINIV